MAELSILVYALPIMILLRNCPLGLGEVLACFLLLGNDTTRAADVKLFTIQKGVQYFQGSPSQSTPDLNNGVSFEADIKANGSNWVTAATLTLPNGASDSVPLDSSDEFK